MRTFELIAEEATLRLEGEPLLTSAPYSGWNYRADLRGQSLHVNLKVADDNPASFVAFFESIAEDWEGWSETRGYESLDGTLRIAATHDRIGAVRFEIKLRGDASSGFDWSASHRLSVKAGDLGKLAAAAKAFAQ